MDKKILITGSAGFIGFHLSELLLKQEYIVIGIDSITNYYDTELKKARIKKLNEFKKFINIREDITNFNSLQKIFENHKPSYVVHLAAQAGVRYSIENPREYLDTNIVGTFNILELIKIHNIKHTLIASTSSVYGSNKEIPFKESQKTDSQISFYAATKKACEILSHSYSHMYNLPITNFRFFTVYGPWGRPDMALFKFVKGILEKEPINVFNNGDMKRDFTYVSDLVYAVFLLIKFIPEKNKKICKNDTISSEAPWRVINIGNSKVETLSDFIKEIEHCLNRKAIKNYLPMQKGDVKETYADAELLFEITGFRPQTKISEGIKSFCDWYKEYYI